MNDGPPKSSTVSIANGSGVMMSQGRSLPYPVLVLSTNEPIIGSLTASHSPESSIMEDTAPAGRPNTLVKNRDR